MLCEGEGTLADLVLAGLLSVCLGSLLPRCDEEFVYRLYQVRSVLGAYVKPPTPGVTCMQRRV